MICSKCNKENAEGAQFCSFCGNSLAATNAPQPVAVQQPVTTAPVAPVAPVPATPAPVAPAPVAEKSGGFSTGQKITVIVLLMGVVAALSLVLLFGKNNLGDKKKDESRTIMIYMDGSNLEYEMGISTVDMESISPNFVDLSKTTVLIYTGGTKEWKNDYVSNEENAIFKLTEDGYEKIETYDKLNMGDSKTLSDFINYAYDNYKAGHYNLIIYDHGGAIQGAVYDDFTDDYLSLDDFKEAMEDSPFNEKNKLDAVLFRTCLNGTLEVATIFEPFAEYIIFSEEVSYGGNNTNVLSFINNLEVTDEGDAFGVKFVDQYKIQMETLDFFGRMGVTYSVVDLSKVNKIVSELDKFIDGVDLKKNYVEISRIRSGMYQYASASSGMYDTIDLYALIDKLGEYSSTSSEGVKSAIKDAVIYNHTNIESSNGISIYFPYNGRGYRQQFLKVYDNLIFSDNYRKFINDFYNAQSSASSFAYDFSKNETKSVEGGKEVSIQLTPEQFANYSTSTYTVFERDKEHPDYYKLLYNSNDVKVGSDGTLTTTIGNNLIVAEDEDGTIHLPIFHRKNDNIDHFYASSILYSNKKDITDKNHSFVAFSEFAFKDDKPFIAAARVSDAADERNIGTLLDLKEYDVITITCNEYKILDKNGNYTTEWEGSPTITAVRANIDDLGLKKVSLGDGEYYVVFNIGDVNNEFYNSGLIKVG